MKPKKKSKISLYVFDKNNLSMSKKSFWHQK